MLILHHDTVKSYPTTLYPFYFLYTCRPLDFPALSSPSLDTPNPSVSFHFVLVSMADSFFVPLPAKSSNAHSSLLFRNCPSPSRFLPPKSSSSLLNGSEKKISVLALSLYSRVSLPHRAAPIRALDSDVPHPLHKVFWISFFLIENVEVIGS